MKVSFTEPCHFFTHTKTVSSFTKVLVSCTFRTCVSYKLSVSIPDFPGNNSENDREMC